MGLESADEAIPKLLRFEEILREEAIPAGFLGPNEADRIFPRHILESAALVPFLPSAGSLVDVGAGAGLPAIPIACLVAGQVTAVEANGRRAAFLRRVADELALDLTVETLRAEEFGQSGARESFGAATCRALASPAVALELCLPLVSVGGDFVWPLTPSRPASTSPDPAADARGVATSAVDAGPTGESGWSRGPRPAIDAALQEVARVLGGEIAEIAPLEVPGADAPRWGMIVNKLTPTPERFPRRTGVPARKPLG